jgi:hypothetical protein
MVGVSDGSSVLISIFNRSPWRIPLQRRRSQQRAGSTQLGSRMSSSIMAVQALTNGVFLRLMRRNCGSKRRRSSAKSSTFSRDHRQGIAFYLGLRMEVRLGVLPRWSEFFPLQVSGSRLCRSPGLSLDSSDLEHNYSYAKPCQSASTALT